MSTFTRKFGKYIPGTAILLIHILFILGVEAGEVSGAIERKTWAVVVALLFMLASVVFGYKYPYDGPNVKSKNVNAPTAVGLVILIICFVAGWVIYYWGGVYTY